ncbi:hypothetical protein T484DRAFT_3649698 [Baffinella frigidus]|nr:hypothetical protein T484DRAFT_3649698 [Cryptophyta sp. CCMP2293]
MEGIYTEELAMFDAYAPDITRESSTLFIPWEGWTDTDQPTAASMCTAYIQTGHLENDAEYTQTMSPLLIDEAPQELPIIDTVPQTVYTQPVSLSLTDAVVDTTLQPQQEQTATDWGYETPVAVIDEPTILNKRGLPMRRSAMQVEERVKSIARWENATEDSAVVREIASAIDQEITRESSRKRIRLTKTETDPVAYDSEMSDGADGNSECEQDSEPDIEDPDTDFVVADEDENDEHGEDIVEDENDEHGEDTIEDEGSENEYSDHEEDSSEDDLTTDEESGTETDPDGLILRDQHESSGCELDWPYCQAT